MMKLFREKRRFMRALSCIADLIGLNLLTLLFCVPVFTAGAAITAVYSCVFRIRENREGYLIKDFWQAFKNNFRQATVIWLTSLAIFVMLYMDYFIFAEIGTGMAAWVLQIMTVAVGIIILEILSYALPMVAYFINPIRATVKNAVLLGISKLFFTLFILALNIIPLLFLLYFPVFLGVYFMVGIAGIAWVNSFLLLKLFKNVTIK